MEGPAGRGKTGKDATSMSAEEYHRQLKYDAIHHRKRFEELKAEEKLDELGRRLLEQSRRCLSNPCEGFNSVDLNDTDYLKELDQYDKQREERELSSGN